MMHEERRRHRLRELRDGSVSTRMRRSSSTTSRSGAITLSSSSRLVMRSDFELHHGLEMFAGDALEIGRVVERREGVLLAAEAGDDFRELARRVLRRSLKHQVFEKMRDARLSQRIIGRAVAIPDHVGDDGNAMIRDHHHVETIVKGEGRDLGPPPSVRPKGVASVRGLGLGTLSMRFNLGEIGSVCGTSPGARCRKAGAVSGGVILRAVGSTTWMRPMDRFKLVSLHRDTAIRQSSKRSRAPLVRKGTSLPVFAP